MVWAIPSHPPHQRWGGGMMMGRMMAGRMGGGGMADRFGLLEDGLREGRRDGLEGKAKDGHLCGARAKNKASPANTPLAKCGDEGARHPRKGRRWSSEEDGYSTFGPFGCKAPRPPAIKEDLGAFFLPEEVLGAKPRRSIGLGAVFTAPSGQLGKEASLAAERRRALPA